MSPMSPPVPYPPAGFVQRRREEEAQLQAQIVSPSTNAKASLNEPPSTNAKAGLNEPPIERALPLDEFLQAWDGATHTQEYLRALLGIRTAAGLVQMDAASWWYVDDASGDQLFAARWKEYSAEESQAMENALQAGVSSVSLGHGLGGSARTVYLQEVDLGGSFNPILPGGPRFPFDPPLLPAIGGAPPDPATVARPRGDGEQPLMPSLASFYVEQPEPILGTHNTRAPNAMVNLIRWWQGNIFWIGFGSAPASTTGPYGVVTVSTSLGPLTECAPSAVRESTYTSVMRPGDGLAKVVAFRDLAGGYRPAEPNALGELCNVFAKYAGSIKMFRLCGANSGVVEVQVGPSVFPLAYFSLLKPGMGLTTVQAFGQVAMPPEYPEPPDFAACARATVGRRVARVLDSHRAEWEEHNLWIADQVHDQARTGVTIKVLGGDDGVLALNGLPGGLTPAGPVGVPCGLARQCLKWLGSGAHCVSPFWCTWGVIGKPRTSCGGGSCYCGLPALGKCFPGSLFAPRVGGSDALDLQLSVDDLAIAYVMKDQLNLDVARPREAGLRAGDNAVSIKLGFEETLPDTLETDSLQTVFRSRIPLRTADGMALDVSNANGCVPGLQVGLETELPLGLFITFTGQVRVTVRLESPFEQLDLLSITSLAFANPFLQNIATLGCLDWAGRPLANALLPRLMALLWGSVTDALDNLPKLDIPGLDQELREALRGLIAQAQELLTAPDGKTLVDLFAVRVIWPNMPEMPEEKKDLKTSMTVEELVNGVGVWGDGDFLSYMAKQLLVGKTLVFETSGPVGTQQVLQEAAKRFKMEEVGRVGPFAGWSHMVAINAVFRLLSGGTDTNGNKVPGPVRELLAPFVQPLIGKALTPAQFLELFLTDPELSELRDKLEKIFVQVIPDGWWGNFRWWLKVLLFPLGPTAAAIPHGVRAWPLWASFQIDGISKGNELIETFTVKTTSATTTYVTADNLKTLLGDDTTIPTDEDAVVTRVDLAGQVALKDAATLTVGNLINGVFREVSTGQRVAILASLTATAGILLLTPVGRILAVFPIVNLISPLALLSILVGFVVFIVFLFSDTLPPLNLNFVTLTISKLEMLVVSSATGTAFTSLHGRVQAPAGEQVEVMLPNVQAAVDNFIDRALGGSGDGTAVILKVINLFVAPIMRKRGYSPPTIGGLAQSLVDEQVKDAVKKLLGGAKLDVDMAELLLQASGFDLNQFIHHHNPSPPSTASPTFSTPPGTPRAGAFC